MNRPPPSHWLATSGVSARYVLSDAPGQVDVIVIGGGVMGLSVAYWLARVGLDVLVLEARRIGWGASGRNAGLMLAGGSALENLDWIESVLAGERIDAGLARPGHLALAASDAMLDRMRDELARRPPGAASLYVLDRSSCEDLLHMKLAVEFRGGRWLPAGATIDPARFIHGLARAVLRHGGRIAEDLSARRIVRPRGADSVDVKTDARSIRARHVIVAANVRSLLLLHASASLMEPARGQVLSTVPMPPLFPLAMAVDWGTVYWRQTADGTIVMGGCRGVDAKAEESARELLNARIQAALEAFLPRAFPKFPAFRVARRWAGIMDDTRDGRPIVGPWKGDTAIWVAAGFGGHGLPPALAVGRELAESIRGGRVSDRLRGHDPARFNPAPAASRAMTT